LDELQIHSLKLKMSSATIMAIYQLGH